VKNGAHTVIVLLGLTLGFSGCRREESGLTAPTGPSPAPAAPAGSQPRISAINPTAVTTLGDGFGIISGTGFERTARVWLGSDAPQQIWVKDAQTIEFWTNAHEAGTVDVVVRNSGGLEDTLARGFTFAPPDAFDFNGTWVAHAGDEYDTDMGFVIENNRLTSVTCGSSLTVAFVAPPVVSHGEFAGQGESGVKVSGRIVSATNAVGAIDVAPCAPLWWADKSTAAQFAR
jgi:hypothetical protein